MRAKRISKRKLPEMLKPKQLKRISVRARAMVEKNLGRFVRESVDPITGKHLIVLARDTKRHGVILIEYGLQPESVIGAARAKYLKIMSQRKYPRTK